MALHGQGKLIFRNTAAVVRDDDAFYAAAFDTDLNRVGSGINGVFDQLLYNRCWPFNHFTGCDLAN